MGITALPFSVGDRAPAIVGATASGRFFSMDGQAGRPALIVALGALEPEAAARLIDRLKDVRRQVEDAGVDLVPVVPPLMPFTSRFSEVRVLSDFLIYLGGTSGLDAWSVKGAAGALLIDRGGRIVDIFAVAEHIDIPGRLALFAQRIAAEPAQVRKSAAPVLMLPNIAPPALCRALIDHFEASPHAAGAMASFSDGAAYAKLDEGKKRRRDTELTAESPLFAEVVGLLSTRVIPEIKRAFQAEIANADRILIARYDDTGGYFKRHRDDAAPHTAFREFAISLNLNTDEYEGGELRFPEYDDHRY